MNLRKKTRIKRILILISGLLALIGIIVVLFCPIFIHINGNKEIEINVFETYEELGATSPLGNVKISGKVDTNKIGTYKISYQVFLEKATRKVKVVDKVAPTLNLKGLEEVEVIKDSKYVEKGYEASDNYDQDVKVVVEGKIDTSKLSDITLTYKATDSSNNITTVKRIVHVVEDDYRYENHIEEKIVLPEKMKETLLDFYNQYYKSIRYSKVEDFAPYFVNQQDTKIMETALQYIFDYRKLSNHDLNLNDCYYDLVITKMVPTEKGIKISFLEDCYTNFNFMYETTSAIFGIENSITLASSGNGFKITDFSKVEGWYNIFKKSTNLEETYHQLLEAGKNQKEINKTIVPLTKSATYPYDRQSAIDYANLYYHERNDEYMIIDGNNCMNYGSQVMVHGGIPMDHTGAAYNQQWKMYSENYNENQEPNGYVYTWTYIPSFRSYCNENTGAGLVAEVNASLYLGEPGDMIQISSTNLNEPVHNMVVVDVAKDDQGNVDDLIVNGNTLDMYHYPLSASCYPYKSLVKIIGYN